MTALAAYHGRARAVPRLLDNVAVALAFSRRWTACRTKTELLAIIWPRKTALTGREPRAELETLGSIWRF